MRLDHTRTFVIVVYVQCTSRSHTPIGAGVIGLAIARQLQARDGASVVLIEKHGSVGTETSSRNSEV